MVTENKCCPQIVVSRYKIRHVQCYYKLYCCMKLVLLWVENLCQMSEQGNGVNGAVWRQLHWQLLVFRFHIYIPFFIRWWSSFVKSNAYENTFRKWNTFQCVVPYTRVWYQISRGSMLYQLTMILYKIP